MDTWACRRMGAVGREVVSILIIAVLVLSGVTYYVLSLTGTFARSTNVHGYYFNPAIYTTRAPQYFAALY